MRRARMLALGALCAAGVCAPAASAAPVTLAQVGTFSEPVYLTSPPGDPRLFVVERRGTVRVVAGGTTLATPFLDVSGRITAAGTEQGLLSVAFPPDYAASGLFYAYFTNRAGNPQVDEMRRSAGSPDVADPAYARTVFEIPHPGQQNHNGGNLRFGPDGLLYAGTGDGGGSGDPNGNAQDPRSPLGKLLRLDPRAGAPPEVFALGLRNPWRFSFDRRTGDLTIADVGQNAVEEVDFAAAPDRGRGANYGWNRYEGDAPFAGSPDRQGLTFPVITHTHAEGWCSITGGHVVRDAELPELTGRYVYGDYCKGDLYAATLPGAVDDGPLGLHVPSLSSFGEDSCGHVYALSLGGPVYRLSSGGGGDCPAAGAARPVDAAPAPTAADRIRPTVRLDARRQRRGRAVRFFAACDEQCTVTITARALGRRVGRLHGRALAPGARVPLRLPLGRSARHALAQSLRRHRSVVLRLRASAVDAAGNVGTAAARLRLARR